MFSKTSTISSASRTVALSARNALRHRRRALIAIGSIAFGVAALIIAGGFIGWVLHEMRELSIRTYYGHLQVAAQGFRERGAADPFAFLSARTAPIIAELERRPDVATVAPRLSFAGLASHGDTTLSFIAEGVDPEREDRLGRALIFLPGRGSNLRAGDSEGVVLGQGLAANLGVKTGDKVVLLANTASGAPNAAELTVRGVFLTVNKAFDDAALRLPIATARRLLRATGAQSWVVLLSDTGHTARVVDDLRDRAGQLGVELVPWTELAEDYLRTEALFARQLGAVSAILAALIVLGISSTMTMSVLERTAEIGTAMALGASRRRVLAQFALEGAVLGAAGAAIGAATGCALALLLSWIGIPLPPPPGLDTPIVAEIRLDGSLVGGAMALAFGTTLLASIYPAFKASGLVIVDALRHAKA